MPPGGHGEPSARHEMRLHALSATESLRRLSQGELSAVELVTALLNRADEVEPKVNAFTDRFSERVLDDARRADEARTRKEPLGPLHGLPVTIKESISTRGTDVTLGVKSRRGQPAGDDAVVVRALRHAGALILGKTNVSQTLMFVESDNPIWGRTNNPWNRERTAGGSSGGEAAAIASGMSVVGVGTDIGGSLRIPAHFSGIAALKPTADRWSNVGLVSALGGQEAIRAQSGPIARSARDLALMMRAIDSPIHSAYDPAVPPMLTLDPTRTDVSLLRIGYYDDNHFFTPAASARRAVGIAVQALKAAGARLVPFEPPDVVEAVYLYIALMTSDGGQTLERFLGGDEVVEQLRTLRRMVRLPGPVRAVLTALVASQGEARIERMLQVLHERPVHEYWALVRRRAQLRLEHLHAWDRAGIDAVICPVHVSPALRHGDSREFSLGGADAMLYNLFNLPAGSVPVTRVTPGETARSVLNDRLDRIAAQQEQGSEGLPVGVQVVSRPYREDVALAIMIALEDAGRSRTDFPVTPVDPV